SQQCPEFCGLCLVDATCLQVDRIGLQKCHNHPRFVLYTPWEFGQFNLAISIHTFNTFEHTASSISTRRIGEPLRCKHHMAALAQVMRPDDNEDVLCDTSSASL